MSIYLGFKEVWRNKGRFILFSLVITPIAVLSGTREFDRLERVNQRVPVIESIPVFVGI